MSGGTRTALWIPASAGMTGGEGDARFLPPQERRGGVTRGPIAVAAGARTLVGDGAPPSRMASVGRRPLGGRGTWRKGYGVPASAGTTVAGVAWPTLAHFGAPWAARRRGPRLRGESTEEVRGRQRRPRAACIGAPQAGCRPSCAPCPSLPVRERGCEVPASAGMTERGCEVPASAGTTGA